MQLIYAVEAGWPSNLTTINNRLGALRRWSRSFKIGITNSPEARIAHYESTEPRRYGEMRVIYRTSSRTNAVKLEKRLVGRYRYDPLNKNERDGGGGPHGNGAYYLYVVRRRRRARS